MNPSIQTASLTPDQLTQFTTDLTEFHRSWPDFKDLPESVRLLQERADKAENKLKALRTSSYPPAQSRGSLPGVTEELAEWFGNSFVIYCAVSGRLEALSSSSHTRDALLHHARIGLSLTSRTALTTNDIPLPSQFSGEIRELISKYGVVRPRMSHYPIGLGTARPARMGTRPSFGCIAMSAPFPEKSPTISFASLESHKIGGTVRLPREIDEQSIVGIGRFLANYGIIEFAKAEDQFGFLADGSADVESISGIVQVARDSGHMVQLPTTKTSPSDASLDEFRAMRRLVNKAALSGRFSAYYLDTTWETRLSAFKTQAEPNVYQRLPDGSATLDGYPIVWTDVLEPYGTAAAANKCIAVFGALSFWWMGEHGTPRIDTSEHVFFSNDQFAVRFIEEIDFDYCAIDATSALITGTAT